MARQCSDLTYIKKHGEADVAHADELAQALEAEMTMGYRDAPHFVGEAARNVVDLIAAIYS
jgi:hypothetical protein